MISSRIYRVLLRFVRLSEFYRVLLGFTGFYWVLLGFTGFYWVSLGFTGFHWVSLGFTGLEWTRVDSSGVYQVVEDIFSVIFLLFSGRSKEVERTVRDGGEQPQEGEELVGVGGRGRRGAGGLGRNENEVNGPEKKEKETISEGSSDDKKKGQKETVKFTYNRTSFSRQLTKKKEKNGHEIATLSRYCCVYIYIYIFQL